jgi:hypothetical protein
MEQNALKQQQFGSLIQVMRAIPIFEHIKIGMREWMPAVWLITGHKKGIASTQLAKDIGVTQKTAWFMPEDLPVTEDVRKIARLERKQQRMRVLSLKSGWSSR